MIRRILKLTLQLAVFVLIVGAFTAAWLIYDGLNDLGDRADLAVVPGMALTADGVPGPTLRTRLDGVGKAYFQGHFPLIFVSGAKRGAGYDEAEGMTKYLVGLGVPPNAIVKDPHGENTSATASDLARYMKRRDLHSVIVVTHYYHISRMKFALSAAGITDIGTIHVGTPQTGDFHNIVREVVAYYYYLGRFYLLPQAKQLEENVQEEAPKVQQEIKDDAAKAKQSVDDKLNNLPK